MRQMSVVPPSESKQRVSRPVWLIEGQSRLGNFNEDRDPQSTLEFVREARKRNTVLLSSQYRPGLAGRSDGVNCPKALRPGAVIKSKALGA